MVYETFRYSASPAAIDGDIGTMIRPMMFDPIHGGCTRNLIPAFISKKRKLSGLGGLELRAAYNSLLQLKETFDIEESEEDLEGDPNESDPEDFVQQLQQYGHVDDLAQLNIVFGGILNLKPIANEPIAATALGQDKLWSSSNLYSQLQLLEATIPRTKEATTRAWIDAFLFCTMVMLPPDKFMVLNMEHAVPATNVSSSSLSTISGYVDYTALIANEGVASHFLSFPHPKTFMKNDLPSASAFFVIEAKFLINLVDHVPQAVSKIYARGRFLQRKVLRGAFTNGCDWIFLLMEFNDNFDGAIYKQSEVVGFSPTQSLSRQLEIPKPWPDVIAAVLACWIENSFADFGSDDWFET